MKEKNKKILKGVGVGALACLGVVGLTGCSNVEISKDKVDSMVETVQKADKYMEDQLKLLEEQNKKLQEQNNILKEQNNKFTKQDAADRVNLSQFKILFNQDNILDNLKTTSVDENGKRWDSYYYVTSNGTKMFYDYEESADGDYSTLIYDIDGMNAAYCYWLNDEEVEKEIVNNPEADIYSGNMFGSTALHSMSQFLLNTTSENIVSCNKTQDGNYSIVLYKETGITDIGNIYADMIIDENNRILSIRTGDIDFTNMDYVSLNLSPEMTFKYNTITDEDVADVLSKAQNTECQEEAILLYNQAYRNLMSEGSFKVDSNGITDGVEQYIEINIKDNKAYITGNSQEGYTIQEWYQQEGEDWCEYIISNGNYNKYVLTDSSNYDKVSNVVLVYIVFMGGEASEEILSANEMTISHQYIDGEVKITFEFFGEDSTNGPIVATIRDGRFVQMTAKFDADTVNVTNTYYFNEEDVNMVELPDVEWVLQEEE